MSTYRNEWPCCGSVTETESWQPEACPICELAAVRDDAEVHRIERRKVSEVLAVERAAREKAEAEAARLRAAIRWALGEEGEFGEEPPPLAGKYRQRYWWRTELRKRAALAQEGEK